MTHTGAESGALRPEDPRELGDYRLLSRIGRGGMGTVFLGEGSSGRRVAVKVINRELASEETFRERFRREVTAARQVRRFCTAPVLDAELDTEPLFVVTEYIEGPSLEAAVAERGPLPGSDLEGLAVGVATALAAIHGAGIVHRDLKPANVLLSATGPRVIDFGIARALDAADGPTRTGQFVGTPNYLPPELLRGEPVTPASDVFSWGCVVTYAGTGRPPFAGRTVPEIFYRVAHDEPRLDGLDAGLRGLVASALDKDPRNRPSVQDLLARLVGHTRPDDLDRITETVQASWHGPGPGAPVPPTTPQSHSAPPPTQPVGYQYTAFGGENTRSDTPAGPVVPPSPQRPSGGRSGGRFPAKALMVGGAAAAVLLTAAVLYPLLGGDGPPEKLATAFSDDFSDGGSGWGPGPYWMGRYGYLNNKYRLETTDIDAGQDRWVPQREADDIPKRILVSATTAVVRSAPDGRYGLLCRANNNRGTIFKYLFLVRNDGKGVLLRKVNGKQGNKELDNADKVPGMKPGSANRLQIACEPQENDKQVRLRMWVNGSLVLDYTDTDQPLSHGWAGLVVERGGNAAQQTIVDFDDFDMSKILD
ncbi:hypothetical protein Acsp03_52210 [Actinomadura sp. NBRC 104412]|nr:hypothetical protein Acsp03_52210 [Actinomadura sp. NBRC 104412]